MAMPQGWDPDKAVPEQAASMPEGWDPEKAAPVRSTLGELGAGVSRFIPAAAESVAGTIAGAQEAQGQKPGIVSSAISGWAQRKLEENAPQPGAHGPVTNFLAGVPEAVGGAASMMGANIVGDIAGPAGGAAATGAQQYAERYHTALKEATDAGKPEAEARAYASKEAATAGEIGAGFGAIGPLGVAGKIGSRAIGIGAKTAAEVGADATERSLAKEFATKAVAGQAVLSGAGAGQASVTAQHKQEAGLETVSPGEAAIESIPGGLQAGFGFLPFHALAAHSSVKQAQATAKALADPADPNRHAAIRQVYDAMHKEDPVGANMWALNAGEALRTERPIGVSTDWSTGLHPELFHPSDPAIGPEKGITAAQEDVGGRFEGEGGGQPPPAAPRPLALPAPAEGAPDVANRVPIADSELGTGVTEGPAGAEARNDAMWAQRDAAEKARLQASGPLGQAAAAGMDSGAVAHQAEERAATVGKPKAKAEEDQWAKAGGSPEQVQAQANIESVLARQQPISLEAAQSSLKLFNSGESDHTWTIVPHPSGDGYGLVPSHFITPEIADRHSGLQARQAPEAAQKPLMPLATPEAAHAKAAELTAKTGVEHEVIPHPYARDKFAVQEKSKEDQSPTAFNEHEQQTGVNDAIQEPGAREVLQRQPDEAGVPGGERGRVEQGVQGEEVARQGEAAGEARNVAEGVHPDQVLSRNAVTTSPPDGRGVIAIEHGGRALKPEEKQSVAALITHAEDAGHNMSMLHGSNIVTAEPRMETGDPNPTNAPMTVFLRSKTVIVRADILRKIARDPAAVGDFLGYMRHEGWHLADTAASKTPGDALASSDHPAFDIKTDANGMRTPTGGIMKEAFGAFVDPNTATSQILHYPLRDWQANHSDMGAGSAHEWSRVLKNELFAQLGRFHDEHPELMKQELPKAFQLFEDIKNADDHKPGNSLGRAVQQTLRAYGTVRGTRSDDAAANRRADASRAGDRNTGSGVGERAVQQHGDGEGRAVRDSRAATAAGRERGAATRDDFSGEKVTGLLGKKNWSILTAENPGNKTATPEENAKANSRLEADLKKLGVDYQRVKGKYGGPEENSFAVTGITKEQAHALRDKYGQDSVLTREGFEHADGSVTPAKSIELKGKGDEDYYTRMPDGTKFAADMDWDGRTKPTKEIALNVRADDRAIDIRENGLPKGVKLPPNADIPDIAKALNKLAPERSYDNPKDVAGATKQLFKELKYQLKQLKSGLGWYHTDIGKAWRWAAMEHPELAHDPVKRQLVSIITGLHSPSVKARKNFTYGLRQYEYYKEHGTFSPIIDPTTGQRWSGKPAHESAIDHVNQMLADTKRWGGAEHAEEGVVNWLLTEHPRAVLAGERARYGVWKREASGHEHELPSDDGAWLDTIPHTAERTNEKPVGVQSPHPPVFGFKGKTLKVGEEKEHYLGTEMFGPKVGPFIGNLNGMNTGITVDVWATRTLRRMFGTLPTETKDGGVDGEGPTPQERNIITMMLRQAAHDKELKDLGIKNGPDAQGVAWFFEQQLYDRLTGGTESGFFSDGARDYAESKGHIVDESGAGAPALTEARVPTRPTEEHLNAQLNEHDYEGLHEDRAHFVKDAADKNQDETRPPFYSGMDRAIEEKAPFAKDGTISAAMLKNWLDARTKDGAVKRDELEWTGIREWLDLAADAPDKQYQKVSRADVKSFLDQNGVKVTETELGADNAHDVREWWNDEGGANEETPYDELTASEKRMADARYQDEVLKYETNAQYAAHQLPGGKNYRELLLTLPKGDSVGGRGTESLLRQSDKNNFYSSHFEQPNILAHVRFNERTDSSGKKVLFIEELQSDWAQKGRKEGFRPANPDPLEQRPIGEVPSAPFVGKTEAWTALALKRIIRYAVDNGFDRVAWANGRQQADRYSLSKAVESIGWHGIDRTSGSRYVSIALLGNRKSINLAVDKAGVVQSAGDFSGKKLEEIIGKTAAEKVVAADEGELSGDGLKIGGEGMHAYYDKIVPNVANDVLKKLGGGRVDEAQIPLMSGKSQQGFDITPAMSSKVKEGQPLFVKEDGRKVPERELLPKATGGKAAVAEAQFTKSGDVVREKPLFVRETPDWLSSASPEAVEFAKNAGLFVEHKTWKQRWAELKKDLGLKIIQATVDQYRPVQEHISHYSYQLLRMASASDNGLAALVSNGAVELNKWGALQVKQGSKSLKDVMAPLAGEHDRFFAWMAAQRAQELMKEGREHNFTNAQIAAGLKFNDSLSAGDTFKGHGSRKMAYAKAMKEFSELNKSVLDIGEAAGTIDPEARKLYEREFYVNFRREKNGEPAFEPNNIAGMVNTKGIKRLKGGEDVLHDLMANTMDNWSGILSGALKNNAAWHTLEEAETLGIARRVKSDEKGSVFVLQDGKPVHWVIDDPLVSQALGSLNAVPFKGPVMHALTKFKHALTFGVTISPTFRINNVIRDQIAAVASNPTSYNFVKNMIEGFKYSSRNNPEYGNMLAGGALIRMGQNLGDERGALAKRLIEEGIDPAHVLDSPNKIASAFKHTWDWWQETGERSESITRAELYRQTYKKMIEQGHDPERAHFEASYIARDAMDFGLHGTSAAVRMITQVVPFMNARLQGLYKLQRGAAADPKRFYAVIGGVTMATIALSLANRDDKEIQARSEWERDNFWLVRMGGTVFRLPKPFEIGAMATVIDRGLEAALDGLDATARERFVSRLGPIIGNQLNMNPIPQAAAPLIQLWGNKSWFTDRAIESARDQNLPVTERVGPGTTATAQALSKGMNAILPDSASLSPEQIDFLVNSYLGWAGNHALMTADLAARPALGLPDKPTGKIDNIPVVGDFFKQLPGNQSRFTEQYYDHLKKIQESFGDLRMLQQTGQLEKAAEVMKEKKQDIQLHGLYMRTQRELGKINQRERWVNMRNMDPDEKREELDRLAQLKNHLTLVAESSRARAVNSQ
jgi:hypothetical protein